MSAVPLVSATHSPAPAPPQIEMELVDCLLCGGQSFDTVIVSDDATHSGTGRYRVVQCRDCGLKFTNPRPTSACIGHFYQDDYKPYQSRAPKTSWRDRLDQRLENAVLRTDYGYPPQPVDWTTRCLSRIGLLKSRRSRTRQSWIPFRVPGRLLDFGCGAGHFLQKMRAHGWATEGIDFSAHVAEEVQQRTGIRVHIGTLPHPDVLPGSFDAVTMWNALEHVYEPRATVSAARQVLRRGGLLVVGVPNIESWSYRRFQHAWTGLELPRHLVHFAPQSLCTLLERENFRVLQLQHVGRDGWIRHSAREAARRADAPWTSKLYAVKSVASLCAARSEQRQEADFIVATAEKI